MDVVIVAANAEQIQNIVHIITDAVFDMNIETFVDPLMALKHLYADSADLVFVKDKIKTIPAGRFVNLVRRHCKDIDITVLSNDNGLEKYAVQAGADRLVPEPLTAEAFGGIVKEFKNFIDE